MIKIRPTKDRPYIAISRMSHPTSFIGVMNAWSEFKPLESHQNKGH